LAFLQRRHGRIEGLHVSPNYMLACRPSRRIVPVEPGVLGAH
jgi:hypothetical protein